MVEVLPKYTQFHADVGGEEPLEEFYAGASGRVSVDLNRFNWRVLKAIQDRPRSNSGDPITPGFDDAGRIGTPMIRPNGVGSAPGLGTYPAHALFLRFPFRNKEAYQNGNDGNLPDGYRFFRAFLDPERCVMGSTSVFKIHLSWRCRRYHDRTRITPYGRGGLYLYDENMEALEGLQPD